jgi:hypothetical protein
LKPVNRALSMVAAIVSLAGCVIGLLAGLGLAPGINPLPLFGVYCLLIGYLVFNSTYLPKPIGILMMLGGAGWLTFAVPPLASALSPYNFGPGIFAEGVLTLWLVFAGVDRDRWIAMTSRPQH